MNNRSNSEAVFKRLHVASLRAISANGIGVVGKDGRHRLVLEWVDAHGALGNILRELSGEIPQHEENCAVNKSPVKLCDCGLLGRILAIVEGAA